MQALPDDRRWCLLLLPLLLLLLRRCRRRRLIPVFVAVQEHLCSHANQIARKRGVVKEVVVTEVILTDKKDPSKTET